MLKLVRITATFFPFLACRYVSRYDYNHMYAYYAIYPIPPKCSVFF